MMTSKEHGGRQGSGVQVLDLEVGNMGGVQQGCPLNCDLLRYITPYSFFLIRKNMSVD
jgi:hypothetical protein